MNHINLARYIPLQFYEQETRKGYIGCKSLDFAMDGEFYNYQSILERVPEIYNPFLNSCDSLSDNISLLSEAAYYLFGIRTYDDIINMLLFDLLIGNEDRHISNFGIVSNKSGYQYILFDHGLSLLSDRTTLDRYKNIEDIIYKPFYLSYEDTLKNCKAIL